VTVSWTTDGAAFVVALTNPPANQLGQVLIEGLSDALDAFESAGARALVVTSTLDGFFAAGADIKLMESADAATFAAYGASLRAVLDRLTALSRPSIAVIEGRALGGGLELALACTLRVAGTNARLGLPEPKLGLIPGAGGTQRLPRLIGRGRALDMMLTAREVDADEALRIGLVDRLTQPGTARTAAIELATGFAGLSRPALEAVLRCVDDAAELPLADGMAREARRVEALFDSPDGREGLAAFLAKRPATFA
jgi:enoyl-CoA hydratase/carnithine racemase